MTSLQFTMQHQPPYRQWHFNMTACYISLICVLWFVGDSCKHINVENIQVYRFNVSIIYIRSRALDHIKVYHMNWYFGFMIRLLLVIWYVSWYILSHTSSDTYFCVKNKVIIDHLYISMAENDFWWLKLLKVGLKNDFMNMWNWIINFIIVTYSFTVIWSKICIMIHIMYQFNVSLIHIVSDQANDPEPWY